MSKAIKSAPSLPFGKETHFGKRAALAISDGRVPRIDVAIRENDIGLGVRPNKRLRMQRMASHSLAVSKKLTGKRPSYTIVLGAEAYLEQCTGRVLNGQFIMWYVST